MTIQQMQEAHQSRPFRPFTIHTADGRSYPVPHPDFLSRNRAGRTWAVVSPESDAFHILDLLMVTAIEFHESAATSNAG